jgi:CHASE2 domain-containing sensor protein
MELVYDALQDDRRSELVFGSGWAAIWLAAFVLSVLYRRKLPFARQPRPSLLSLMVWAMSCGLYGLSVVWLVHDVYSRDQQ